MADIDDRALDAAGVWLNDAVYPSIDASTISVDPAITTLEDFLDAMIDGRMEEFMLTLPRRELTSADDVDVVEVFREAAMTYLFR